MSYTTSITAPPSPKKGAKSDKLPSLKKGKKRGKLSGYNESGIEEAADGRDRADAGRVDDDDNGGEGDRESAPADDSGSNRSTCCRL